MLGAGLLAGTGASTATAATSAQEAAAYSKVVGYFTEWGTYDRKYYVKNIETSGSADRLTHINYAFGNVTGGKCAIGDSYAATDRAYTAGESVDGTADTWDQPLRGTFNQLRKLKEKHPDLKVIWSFGGWTWSGGFGEAAKNPAAFAQSCLDLVEDPRWADIFDGIDIDWEYPNACGATCDTSGRDAYRELMKALRSAFGSDSLVTAAIPADATPRRQARRGRLRGRRPVRRLVQPDDVRLLRRLGHRRAHRPALAADLVRRHPEGRVPQRGHHREADRSRHPRGQTAARHRLLRPRLDRRHAGGAGRHRDRSRAGHVRGGDRRLQGPQDKCPATGTVGGTAYAKCGDQWWSYDTPQTVAAKTDWKNAQGLGGTFFWELSGDTADGELIKAIR